MATPRQPPWLLSAGCAKRLRRWSEEGAVAEALLRIDRAHRSPFSKANEAEYCEAVERWAVHLRRLAGEQASPALRLGARAQHLERGAIPRKSYPEGREGYLRWRAAVKRRQGQRVEELLRDLAGGLGLGCAERVKGLVSKALPLRPHICSGARKPRAADGEEEQGDAEMQCVEDAACLVFLEQELKEGFPEGKDDAKMVDILQKTWRKMSRLAHAEALKVDYTPRMLGCVVEAIAEAEAPSARQPSAAPTWPVPALSAATRQILAVSWEACRGIATAGDGNASVAQEWGEAWYEELRQIPGYEEDLGRVLSFPVCRPENITKVVDTLLGLLTETEGELPSVAADGSGTTNVAQLPPPAVTLPRFAALLRSAALLAQRHAGLQLRHLDALRCALVAAACKRGARGLGGEGAEKRCLRAWEAFGYAIGSQVAPALMLSDTASDFTAAVATALPTPGAVPCAAVLAAKGLGLVEMSLRILDRKRKVAAATEEASASSVVARLGELRAEACRLAQADAHAYCGLLAAAVFDSAGGDGGERKDRRARWTRRCTVVPLCVARCALEGVQAAVGAVGPVRAGAASATGDLAAGGSLLLEAAQLALRMADLNLGGSDAATFGDLRASAAGLRLRGDALRRAWGDGSGGGGGGAAAGHPS